MSGRLAAASRIARAWAADARLVRDRARKRGARSPWVSAAGDPSLWAVTLLRGASALRATVGSSMGLSTVLRVGFHIDVWTDDVGAGLSLPHPFGIVVGGGAHIGEGCTLLHGVTVQHGSAWIGDGAVIANGATVLRGATVGDGCLIGTASVVRGDIPARTVAVGAPARVLRAVREGEAR
jgi:serine acetyltransferase